MTPATPQSRVMIDSSVWPAPVTNHNMLYRGGPDYPPLLSLCSAAPDALHCVGDPQVLALPAVAVVGSRNPSADGARAAQTLGYELARAGFTVISGLARGIDTAAHRGALDAGGKTVAVMATGLDQIYPRSNKKLAHAIVERGAVITEFPPGVEPERWHFPRRNRTISGLALATVVVEAGRPSGSLLTATAASEQGREVFAYPWSVYHKGGEGCRWLLGQGAQLACGADDVVQALGHGLRGLFELSDPRIAVQLHTETTQEEEATDPHPILALIGDGVLELPELTALAELSPRQLLLELGQLELEGKIQSTPLGYQRAGRTSS